MDNLRWLEDPDLRRPVLIQAFAGWNDASAVATTALRFLIDRWDELGADFQEFLAAHRLSSHMWLVARKR